MVTMKSVNGLTLAFRGELSEIERIRSPVVFVVVSGCEFPIRNYFRGLFDGNFMWDEFDVAAT